MSKIGRPKGSKNKKTIGMIMAERKGISPLEFLLSVMDDVENELSVRIDAAKASSPYCHARLSQVEMDVVGNVEVTRIERIIVYPEHKDSPSIPALN